MDSTETEKTDTSRVIEDEMKESYLSYAMSVIVGRALPDVRDGLKPVHRRVLYAMHQMGMLSNKPSKKSARIVGEVLGKFHPHGDTAVYDSMVRMAQEFSLRYPLVKGQGNFGSVDGDAPAAMRYTEAKLTKIAEEVLQDIEKETVQFVDNFDGTLQEPSFLPAKVPNLLINGSSGIAVGMATNIPPHNLSEVCDGVTKVIDNPEIEVVELMQTIKAPDFPTGGTIVGTQGVHSAYAKGHGKVIVQSKTTVEETNSRKSIIVSEIPYMVNKANLLEHIASLVKEKRLEGISDLRDESDRDGMRIVIELKQHANDQIVLNQLFKHTRLQETIGIIFLSIVDGEPKVLHLKGMLNEFIKHRQSMVRKRTEYDLKQAKEREHILLGLIKALDSIDDVIKRIKASKTVQDASAMLEKTYSLSEIQAKAILEMRLQKLSSLEQQKLRDEQKELLTKIKEYETILASEEKILGIIKEEVAALKATYGDVRRSDISEGNEDITDEDLIQQETMVVTLTHAGYVKRVPLSTYKAQRRGGKGIKATTTKEEDFVEDLFVASTHDYVLAFTDKGKVYWKKVYSIPEASRQAKGIPIVNLVRTEQGEKVSAVIPISSFKDGKYLVFATKKGTVKRTPLEAYSHPRKGGIIAITLEEGDELMSVLLTSGKEQLLFASKNGSAVKCKETDISVVGRSARGVRGMRLREGDKLIGMVRAPDEQTLLTVTQKGFGKRTKIEEYRLINRGGSGVRNIKCTEKNGHVIDIKRIENGEELLFISKSGVALRTKADSISTIGRNTQGVRVMRVGQGDEVVAVAKVPDEEIEIKEITEPEEELHIEVREKKEEDTKKESKKPKKEKKQPKEYKEVEQKTPEEQKDDDEVSDIMKQIQKGHRFIKNAFTKKV